MVLLELEIAEQKKALEPARLEREKARAQILTQNQREDDIEVSVMGMAICLALYLIVRHHAETCWGSRQDSQAS